MGDFIHFYRRIYLSLCACFLFCSFIPFLLVFLVFQKKDLVLLNLISRYLTSTREYFLKSIHIAGLCKANFCISKFFIQCGTGSCCVHIRGALNIYSYMCESVYCSLSVTRVFVCVYDIKSEFSE